MQNDISNRRAVIIAALVASSMMLVFGVGYRVLAARLEGPVSTTPVSQEALERFPMQMGDWTGRDVPMDEAIARQTDTDARINRLYSRHNGLEAVSFYVAGGVRARDLMPHCPEVCYTGSGWTLTARSFMELPLSDEKTLPCNVFQFSRGVLNTQKVVVLYYYIVDGQYCADVSLLRSKAWLGSGTVGYVAQVEVVTAITETMPADSATRLVSDFAVESALPTAGLFEKTEKDQSSD